jgi:leader peptidase (prepilin peptidase) / N-methyltransferase
MSSEHLSVLAVTIPLAGIVGLFVGSFLNVVIYRAPLGLSVATPRSFCPTCDRQLSWWENVPLVSWLGLRGRCHTCHEAISIRYPLVELATGVSFALTTWAWDGTILAAAYCILAASMIAVGLIEYGGQRAPLSVAAIGVSLAQIMIIVGGTWQHRWAVVFGSLVGTIVALAATGILYGRDPECADPRGHGRSALLLVGCWTGGLGLAATALGASGSIVAYVACMAGMWATTHQTATVGGLPTDSHSPGHPLLTNPLVTAIVVAMVASLLVGV